MSLSRMFSKLKARRGESSSDDGCPGNPTSIPCPPAVRVYTSVSPGIGRIIPIIADSKDIVLFDVVYESDYYNRGPVQSYTPGQPLAFPPYGRMKEAKAKNATGGKKLREMKKMAASENGVIK